MRRNGQSQGFTLIEVMISLLVFMVALMGLVALQRASIAGTNKGREQTAAINLARFTMTWIENEATSWPLSEPLPPAADFPMLAQAMNNEGQWNLLADGSTAAPADFRLDAYLEHSYRDFYATQDTAPYCVHYMVRGVGPNDELLRIRVRVVWPKWKQYVIEADESPGTWDNCAWPGWNDPATLESRVRYSEVVEMSGIATRETTGQLVQ